MKTRPSAAHGAEVCEQGCRHLGDPGPDPLRGQCPRTQPQHLRQRNRPQDPANRGSGQRPKREAAEPARLRLSGTRSQLVASEPLASAPLGERRSFNHCLRVWKQPFFQVFLLDFAAYRPGSVGHTRSWLHPVWSAPPSLQGPHPRACGEDAPSPASCGRASRHRRLRR